MSAHLAFRYSLLESTFDERMKRLWAASEALALGEGGVTILSELTSLSPRIIRAGIRELGSSAGDLGLAAEALRSRRRGAGRKPLWLHDDRLEMDLRSLLESSRVAPESPLEWTCKSTRRLAGELAEMGHRISYRTVGTMLSKRGFRFPPLRSANRRVDVEERLAQFLHLSRLIQQALERQQPVLSLAIQQSVAPNPQRSQAMRPLAPDPELVLFAVAHLHMWWRSDGKRRFPRASSLLLISDSSGSLGDDREMWRSVLLAVGDRELRFLVSHLPPGSTRWKSSEPIGWMQVTLPEPLDQHRRIRIAVELIQLHRSSGRSEGAGEGPAEAKGFLEDWNYVVNPGCSPSCG